MVFSIVTSDADAITLLIFSYDYRLNTEVCIKFQEKVLLHWRKRIDSRRHCIMPHKQQDPAMAVRKFLRPHYPSIWPPNSPDCNLFDYYLWGAVKKEINETFCSTKY